MKKYLALLLAGVMMLSLVACGEKQTTDDEQTGNEAGNGSLSSIVDLIRTGCRMTRMEI